MSMIKNRAAIRRLADALRTERPGFVFWYNLTLIRPNERHLILDEDLELITARGLSTCDSIGCALGLAKEIGLIAEPSIGAMAAALGITESRANAIFFNAATYGVDWSYVTAEMVAEELEEELAA